MTYNVRYFGHGAPVAGAASTRRGIEAITRAIASLSALPQVICLQEVETRSMRSTLSHTPGHLDEIQIQAVMKSLDWALLESKQSHRYTAHYFPAHTYRWGETRLYTTGLAILLRDDLRVVHHNALQPHDITYRRSGPAARWKQSRICAHLTVQDASGVDYDIFNTHLSLPAFLSRHTYRFTARMGYGDNQLAEIDRLAEYVAAHRHNGRFVLVGDFNSLPGSPAYQRVIEKLGVQDPFAQHLGSAPELLRKTWPTAGFMRFRMRLDHVFTGPGLDWLDFEDTQPFGAEGRWLGLSDHVPILGRCSPKSP